jgi:hypothetical protein
VDNEGTFDSTLYGVSAASANDIWAVGNYFDATFHSQTLIEHWNGTAWTVVPSPNPGTANNLLFAVSSLAANNAWAVGWYANTNIQQPLVLHWDGSAWTEFSLSVARPRVVLEAISAISQNDIWAVGVSCDIAMCNRHITATLHWDGGSWSVVDSPNPATFDNSLEGVTAVSSSNVWAVGEACTGNGCATTQSLIEHWDGSAWTAIPSPSPGTAITALLGVDANASEAWAVGYTCATSSCVPAQSVTLHWNGTDWSVAPSPNPGSSDTHFNAVTMPAANDAWAVGSESSDGTTFGNVVMHWDGSAWTAVTVTSPGSSNNDLNALTRLSANDIWAVGDFDNGSQVRTQAQHYTGPCTSPTPSATPTASATATITVAASPTPGASATAVTATRTATIATATPATSSTSTSTSTATSVLPTATSGLPTVEPTICTLQFSDVPVGSTFYAYIHCLACRGIINGYPDGTFKPNNDVTRGQLSKIVSNAAGFSDSQTTQLFQDVPVNSTFFQFIGRLASRGYIGGYICGGNGEPCVPPANLPYFRPNNNATRGQISKIVSNAAGFIDPPSGQQFQDLPVGSTYYTYTYRLVTRNVMQGYACGGSGEPCIPPANLPYFRPNNNATRGQTSKIVGNTFFPDCSAPNNQVTSDQ